VPALRSVSSPVWVACPDALLDLGWLLLDERHGTTGALGYWDCACWPKDSKGRPARLAVSWSAVGAVAATAAVIALALVWDMWP
jgi:hypothetical protein